MSPTDRPPKALIAAILAPFGIALAALVYEALGGSVRFFYEIAFVGPLLLVALPIALAQGRLEGRGIGAHARRLAIVSPCLLAPLSIVLPWTVAPGGTYFGMGGFPYFIRWLTKYPNWGPVNYEVLLGILCMLGASSIPVAFAMYHFLARPPRPWVLATFLILDLVALVPLVIYLDFTSFDVGTHSLLGGGYPLACGPLLRVVPAAVMLVLVVRSLRTLAPTPVDDPLDA